QQAEPKPLAQFRTDLPAYLPGVIRKMMAKRPEDRYQTPGEVAQALAQAASPTGANLPAVISSPKGALVPEAVAMPRPSPARDLMVLDSHAMPDRYPASGQMVATLAHRTFQAVGRKLPKTRRPRMLMSGVVGAAVFLLAWWALTPAAPKIAYLSDLNEERTNAPGILFAKNGQYKYVEVQKIDGQVKYFDRTGRISVKGTPYPKGIFMRPSQQGPIIVTYRLDKQYKTFKSTVALADGSGGTEQVFFKVICDGQEKWHSKEFKLPRQIEECEID